MKDDYEKFLKSISETLKSSTIHGIPPILNSKNLIIRLVWIVSFFGSSCACFWFILSNLNEYFKHEVVSKIKINYVNELPFPIISICNINPINTEELNQYMIGKFNGDKYPNMSLIDYAITYQKMNQSIKFSRKALNETIIKCLFKFNDCNLDEEFEYYFDEVYGNCFRFNSGKNMKGENVKQKVSYGVGIYNALELELYIGSIDQNENLFSTEHGLNLFITNETHDSLNGEGINISPGNSYKIIINKYSIIKESYPYSECISDLTTIDSYKSDCYKKVFRSNLTKYHYTDCYYICYQKLVEINCQCRILLGDYEMNPSLRICQKNDFVCADREWLDLISNKSHLTDCDCPFECETFGYNYKISISQFPTKKYYNYLRNENFIRKLNPNMTFEEMRKSLTRLKIFYDEMKETIVSEEIKIDSIGLVSNIGGVFGVFMGFSFLSLIGFVEICVNAFLILCARR